MPRQFHMTETRSVVIEPPRGWEILDLRELWAYRELLYFLIWRDLKVRYKQTAIGAAWAVLQPLLTCKQKTDCQLGCSVA
jgi:lipopolysaccharide transport system permease protein